MQYGRHRPDTYVKVCAVFDCWLLSQVHTRLNLIRTALHRPISKNKAWRVTEIIRREKVYDPVAAAETAAKHVAQQTQLVSSSRGFAASALT